MTAWIRSATLIIAVFLVGCANPGHSESGYPKNGYSDNFYSDAQLDQILAPIALYPDVVLSQVLMAATFPLDIEDAADWSAAHRHLNGSAAVNAVSDREWDLSVQALTAFPDLLHRLADDPSWTWRLGDAYINQESDVLDAIQRLRDRAYAAGHLASEDHLEVYRDDGVIIIEPAYPDRVYLPYYSPLTVYGNWWWPDYPPYYWDSPYGYRSGVSFYWGDGIALSSGFFYSAFHWHNHHIVTFDRGHYRPYRGHGRYYQHYRNPKRWRHHRQHRNVDRHTRRHNYNGADRGHYRDGYRSDRHSQPGYRRDRFRDHHRADRDKFGRSGRYRDGRQNERHHASGERRQDRQFNRDQRSERRYQEPRPENRFRPNNQRSRQDHPAANHNRDRQPGQQASRDNQHHGPGQNRNRNVNGDQRRSGADQPDRSAWGRSAGPRENRNHQNQHQRATLPRDRHAKGEQRRTSADPANHSARDRSARQRDDRNRQDQRQHRSEQRNQRSQAANQPGRERYQPGRQRPDRAGNGQPGRQDQMHDNTRQRNSAHRSEGRPKVAKTERRDAHGRDRTRHNASPNPRARYRGDGNMQRHRAGANHGNGRRAQMQ